MQVSDFLLSSTFIVFRDILRRYKHVRKKKKPHRKEEFYFFPPLLRSASHFACIALEQMPLLGEADWSPSTRSACRCLSAHSRPPSSRTPVNSSLHPHTCTDLVEMSTCPRACVDVSLSLCFFKGAAYKSVCTSSHVRTCVRLRIIGRRVWTTLAKNPSRSVVPVLGVCVWRLPVYFRPFCLQMHTNASRDFCLSVPLSSSVFPYTRVCTQVALSASCLVLLLSLALLFLGNVGDMRPCAAGKDRELCVFSGLFT